MILLGMSEKGLKFVALVVFTRDLNDWASKLTPNWAYDQSIRRYFQMDRYDDVTFEFWQLCGFRKTVENPNGASLNCALTGQFLVFVCFGP